MNSSKSNSIENRPSQSDKMRNIAGKFFYTIGRALALIVAILLCLPVLLLPISTLVPAWIWIPLAIAAIVFLILQFRIVPVWRGVLVSLIGMVLVSLAAVVTSQLSAATPPISDAQGNVLPGSIATLEKVELNGSEQWISIRGKDMNKPVLLFLSGGPGGSQLVTARRTLARLEDHFVVVNWEQPGAGKSFDAVDRKSLNPERYISDGIALVKVLLERFDEEKVYVLGESWGSTLGIWMVQRSPELFHAFIGTGQMVSFLETDKLCYEFALGVIERRGDTKKVEQLKKQGPPPYYGSNVAMQEAAFLMETFNYMNADPNIDDDGFNTFQDLAGPEYGLYDKLNWFLGALETMNVVYPQLWEVDFRKQAVQLDVPVYFLIGRHDVNAPPVLTEDYFQQLSAPVKKLIWFERSGHNPWVTESDEFVDAVVNTVLAETYGMDNN